MKKQHGITFLGFIITAVIALAILLAVIKVVPVYLEHNSVKKIIHNFSDKAEFSTMTKNDIIKSFDKSASVNYVTVVSGQDLDISKGGTNGTVVSIEYQVIEPLAGNLSALMDFEASTEN